MKTTTTSVPPEFSTQAFCKSVNDLSYRIRRFFIIAFFSTFFSPVSAQPIFFDHTIEELHSVKERFRSKHEIDSISTWMAIVAMKENAIIVVKKGLVWLLNQLPEILRHHLVLLYNEEIKNRWKIIRAKLFRKRKLEDEKKDKVEEINDNIHERIEEIVEEFGKDGKLKRRNQKIHEKFGKQR